MLHFLNICNILHFLIFVSCCISSYIQHGHQFWPKYFKGVLWHAIANVLSTKTNEFFEALRCESLAVLLAILDTPKDFEDLVTILEVDNWHVWSAIHNKRGISLQKWIEVTPPKIQCRVVTK